MSTNRELLQQAAALLSTITEQERAMIQLRATCAKFPPDRMIQLPDGESVTKSALITALDRMEAAEIAPVKAQARVLQDQALAMKG